MTMSPGRPRLRERAPRAYAPLTVHAIKAWTHIPAGVSSVRDQKKRGGKSCPSPSSYAGHIAQAEGKLELIESWRQGLAQEGPSVPPALIGFHPVVPDSEIMQHIESDGADHGMYNGGNIYSDEEDLVLYVNPAPRRSHHYTQATSVPPDVSGRDRMGPTLPESGDFIGMGNRGKTEKSIRSPGTQQRGSTESKGWNRDSIINQTGSEKQHQAWDTTQRSHTAEPQWSRSTGDDVLRRLERISQYYDSQRAAIRTPFKTPESGRVTTTSDSLYQQKGDKTRPFRWDSPGFDKHTRGDSQQEGYETDCERPEGEKKGLLHSDAGDTTNAEGLLSEEMISMSNTDLSCRTVDDISRKIGDYNPPPTPETDVEIPLNPSTSETSHEGNSSRSTPKALHTGKSKRTQRERHTSYHPHRPARDITATPKEYDSVRNSSGRVSRDCLACSLGGSLTTEFTPARTATPTFLTASQRSISYHNTTMLRAFDVAMSARSLTDLSGTSEGRPKRRLYQEENTPTRFPLDAAGGERFHKRNALLREYVRAGVERSGRKSIVDYHRKQAMSASSVSLTTANSSSYLPEGYRRYSAQVAKGSQQANSGKMGFLKSLVGVD